MLEGLPKFQPANAVRKLIAERLQVAAEAVSCKKSPKWEHAFVSFRIPGAAREELLAKLDGLEWKRCVVQARFDDGKFKRAPQAPPAAAEERNLHDQVTPLWRRPYAEQLALKQKAMQEVVDQVEVQREGFALEAVRPSPLTTGYRNKCEFSFGLDTEGLPTVGFSLGGFREGTVAVANASDCVHVPACMKALANAVQAHVRSRPVAVFDRRAKEGFWRLLMMRCHGGRLMVVVQAQEGALPAAQADEELASLATLLQAFACEEEGVPVAVGSCFAQLTTAVYHGMDPRAANRLLFGSETLTETLDGLRFSISPASFFQVNKPATLVLYAAVRELVLQGGLGSDTVLLDLCCGTGTIGMMMAGHVARVVGVELVPEAVADAQRNAAASGIANIDFRCAKVEDALAEVLAAVPAGSKIAVVLDPPRSGIHKSVIRTIRNCDRISSVVYVSCNPQACLQNYADLGKAVSRSTTGRPFRLDRSVPVDMFPQTEHCELVLRFVRD